MRESREEIIGNNTVDTRPAFCISEENSSLTDFDLWLAGLFSGKYRKKINWLLPTALKRQSPNKEKLEYALKKLHRYSDVEIDRISRKLSQALYIISKMYIIIPSLLGGLILLR